MIQSAFIVTEITQFGFTDITVIIGLKDEIPLIRVTPSSPSKKSVNRATLLSLEDSLSATQGKKEKNSFVLSASTASVLLQTNARPKWARGPTLNYKAMHEGKQNQSKQGVKHKVVYGPSRAAVLLGQHKANRPKY